MKTYKNLIAIFLAVLVLSLMPIAATKAISVKDLVSRLYLIQKQLDTLSQEASGYFAQQAAVAQEALEKEKTKQTEEKAKEAAAAKTETEQNNEATSSGETKTSIDYSEIAKLQNLVDSGYQNWRLVPVLVLKNEGVNFGFSKEEIEKAKQISYFPNIGVIKYSLTHDSKIWAITLIQPTIGEGKIWTISETKITDN
jgi:hypothetical protein